MVAPVERLVLNIEPHQSGSGTPSPSNIRPISGYDAVNVVRGGSNLAYMGDATVYTSVTYGMTISVDNQTGLCRLNGTYNGASATPQFRFVNVPSIANGLSLKAFEITSGSHVNLVRWDGTNKVIIIALQNMVQNTAYDIQFYIYAYTGAEPSTFTYDFTTYPISLSAAGTVYGGSLDVTTGALTVTDGYIAEYAGETLPSTWISDRDVYASGTTPTTGAQVVYKLSTPVTYTLTPTEVTTLLGNNTVWMDASGTIEMTYTGYIN